MFTEKVLFSPEVNLVALVDDCGSSNYTSSLVSATSRSLLKLDQAHIAVGGREHISLMSVKPTRINRAAGRRKIRASRWNSIGMRIKPFRDSLESET